MTITKKSKRVTIRDVADEVGVSISTVSLYTQGRDGVGEETGQRIADAIDRLGYVRRSRTERPPRSRFFGLLLENLSFSAFPETLYGAILQAIETEAKSHGYSMVLSVIEEDAVPRMVEQDQVDGLIILGGSPLNDAVALRLAERNTPLVLLDNHIPGAAIDSIVPDNEWGGYMAIRHLVELGHRRIAILQGPTKYKTLTDRLWGAKRAADEFGIDIPPAYLSPAQSSGQPLKGYREMQALLQLPELPTAVFAVSDKTAFGALEAIREAGLSVPEDISLIGFDNEVRAEHTSPPLTTIHLPKRYLGILAMRRLIGQIENPSDRPVRLCVPTRLVERASTARYS
ncbi:MAG: LacI family DNA-binding transcriptional regulator [Chloroflexi bacterium]|nr:LacI family DNA-binding transcriptional regulator [Chloroflexota bacterium]